MAMWHMRARWVLAWSAGTAFVGMAALGVRAELLSDYFPAGVPGYGTAPGVTVASRARPEFDPPGVRAGSLPCSTHHWSRDSATMTMSSAAMSSDAAAPISARTHRCWSTQTGRATAWPDSLVRTICVTWTSRARARPTGRHRRRRTVGRPRPAHRGGGAFQPAPAAHRPRCIAIGRTGRLPGERPPRGLHHWLGTTVDHAGAGLLHLSLRSDDDPWTACVAGVS